MRIYVLIAILFLTTGLATLQASDVLFTVSAPNEVAVGERFRVVFTVNERPQQFSGPDFSAFRIVSGPSQSTSTSTQIINQQVTTSVSLSFTYVLEALEKGEFSIGSARVAVEGDNYQSDPFTINVTDRGAAQPDPSRPRQETGEPQMPGADDIFIRAAASKQSPYQGEHVIITYNLYTRLDITNYSIDALPSFRGFWSENINIGQQSARNEVVNGVNYRVAEIRRVAVFPQLSGELRIEAMTVDMGVRVRTPQQQRRGSLFDEFFGSSRFDRFQTVQHSVRSNAITLDVKPLPSQNRPADFKGAVGSYEMSANLAPVELNVNDAANLLVRIQGRGNIRMIEQPNIQFPRHLEVFDPNIDDNVRTARNGISGSREFDYLVIPRSAGETEIPAIRFSYFDPERSEYISRTAGPFTLKVSGDAIAASEMPGEGGETVYLADEIRFISTQIPSWRPANVLFFKSQTFYLLLAAPILLFLIFLLLYRKHLKQKQDVSGMRTKKAKKLARKRLKQANKFLQEEKKNAFFDEIFRTLWGYVSDRLNIPVSRLNKENVAAEFSKKQVSPELAERFLKGLAECEYARFAPTGMDNPMQETYDSALATIVTLEKELRK